MEEDSVLISRGLRRRDPDLLDQLIDRYQHRLYRYLVFFTRDRQLSEDVFQETWMRVLEKGAQFDPRHKFEPWLLRIARNLAIDEMRRRRPGAFVEWDEGEPDAAVGDHGSPRTTAFDALAARETREALERVMDGMPAYYREVLTLRFHEGLALEEISGVSGAPLSTVKSRLRRGLDMLATRLEGRRP